MIAFVFLSGCGSPPGKPDLVWGKRGVLDGDLMRPRAIAIDRADRLFIVDFTARIQVYDLDGRYLGPTWTTPDFRNASSSRKKFPVVLRGVFCNELPHEQRNVFPTLA